MRQAGQDYETYYILRQTDLKVRGFSQSQLLKAVL